MASTSLITESNIICRSERETQFCTAIEAGRERKTPAAFANLNDEEVHIVAKYCALCERIFYHTWDWQQNMALLNGVFLGVVLGGFGTYLSAAVFWVCWGNLLNEAVTRHTLRPFYLGEKSDAPQGRGQNSQPPWAKSVSEFNFIMSTLSSKLILTSILLILLRMDSPTRSDECKPGSSCYSRVTESLWISVIMLFLEIVPCIVFVNWRRYPLILWMLNEAEKNMYAYITSGGDQRNYSKERLTEAFYYLLNVRQDFESAYDGYGSDTKKFRKDLIDASFLIQSALSVILALTIGLVVGGSYGTFMTFESFWLCLGSVFVEGLLTLQLFRARREREETLPDTSSGVWQDWILPILPWVLRFLTQGPLFGLMVVALCNGRYFPKEIDGCDSVCLSRGKEMLYVSIVATGLQSLSFLLSPLALVLGVIVYLLLPLLSSIFYIPLQMLVIIPAFLLFYGLYYMVLAMGALLDKARDTESFGSFIGLLESNQQGSYEVIP